MKKIFFILFSAAAAVTCSAMAVESTPGGLSALVGENTQETSLTVTGSIDASDLDFIASEMTKLESLDISGASIVAYEGKALRNGNFTSSANVLQSYALFGITAKSIALPASLTEIGELAATTPAVNTAADNKTFFFIVSSLNSFLYNFHFRTDIVFNTGVGDNDCSIFIPHLPHFTWYGIHCVEKHVFQYASKPSGACFSLDSLFSDSLQRPIFKLKLHLVITQHRLVLFH